MHIKKISIVVPVYNEIKTIESVLEKLALLDFLREKEIIVVDDNSFDGTREFLKKKSQGQVTGSVMKFLFHNVNKGKGAAIKTALQQTTGDYVIVQDADFEYYPEEIINLIAAAEENNALAVYGSRNKDIKNSFIYPAYNFGVKFLTILINCLYRQKLTDPETCYKLIESNLLKFLDTEQERFGFEIEVTAKLARCGVMIYEVPIHYVPRSFRDGKKIRSIDGFIALYLVFKYFFSRY